MKLHCINNTQKEDQKNEKLGDKDAWENMETGLTEHVHVSKWRRGWCNCKTTLKQIGFWGKK